MIIDELVEIKKEINDQINFSIKSLEIINKIQKFCEKKKLFEEKKKKLDKKKNFNKKNNEEKLEKINNSFFFDKETSQVKRNLEKESKEQKETKNKIKKKKHEN